MNGFYSEFLRSAKVLAKENGLHWELVCDDQGKVTKESRWNLTALVGMMPPPTVYLGQLGVDVASFEKLNKIRRSLGQPQLQAQVMRQEWRDLCQAVVIDQLLVRKNKPKFASALAQSIRQLASAADEAPPWAITPDQVRQAYNAVLQANTSGKVAMNFEMAIRIVFDNQNLADTPALARFCLPFASADSLAGQKAVKSGRVRQSSHYRADRLRSTLAERKSVSKLPEQRAFWEMVRIVFTETPRSFSDVIRFGVLKALIIAGLRVGEAVLLPRGWLRWRQYVDKDGRPAADRGGISRSLMIRHFAEKQVEAEHPGGVSLYENTQHVPPMFEDVLIETLAEIGRITEPLRERLRLQAETGRIFPEHSQDALVPAWEIYTRVTGNALFSGVEIPKEMITKCRETYEPSLLEAIRSFQIERGGTLNPVKVYWSNAAQKMVKVRNAEGNAFGGRINWQSAFLRVGEVENHIRANRATKLSDTSPAALVDGTEIRPHDLLFLMPVRNLIEGRNGGLLDPTRYSAIGRISTADIDNILDGRKSESIFQRYGSPNPESLRLNSHMMRHLQNTELFRLGVADTIITKRFNRRSVAQSYEYDHRSLAEDLENIEVPPEAEVLLGNNARQVYRLIAANRASGPIVEEFRRVRDEYGDAAAFEYLNAEADGLHVTPYGLCMNSFTVDPCPKHLECYKGCIHLARTDVSQERINLERLRDRMTKVVEKITAVPEAQRTVGWSNQLEHARRLLANVIKALAARPGTKPFPDGCDLSAPIEQKRGTSVLDRANLVKKIDD